MAASSRTFSLLCIILQFWLSTRLDTRCDAAHAYGTTGGINQRCDKELFPKTGCEDLEGAECGEDLRCHCQPGNPHVMLDRFCFPSDCSEGYYFDRIKNTCVKQRKASPRPEENYCRFDYQCQGFRVHCVNIAWNYNCVCEAGFQYVESEGVCRPKFGIGGFCKEDRDCDDSGLRMMTCKHNKEDNSAQCTCREGYRFNYNVDGCESVEQIAERENQMRTMIFIFIAAGLFFGLALTCNFGFFSRPPKHLSQELIMKRIKQEEEKYRRQLSKKSTTSGATSLDPEAPPLEPDAPLPEPEVDNSTTKDKLIALI